MPRTPKNMSNRPVIEAPGSSDVLGDVVLSLGLQAQVFCRSELGAPWSMGLPASEFAHFHVIERGSCWLHVEGERRARALSQGDLVVLPQGRGHVLSDAPDRKPVPLAKLLQRKKPGACALLEHGGAGPRTAMICGSFRFRQRDGHPLLSLLPPVLHVAGEAGRMPEWLAVTLRFIAEESRESRPGAEVVLSRLTDVLFIHVVRTWLASHQHGVPSWLSALRDERIARALSKIHAAPSRTWTVETLAREAGMSRSPFASRFAALVGAPPLSYLTRWRMQVAGELLRSQSLGLAEVAARAGYESEAAFSKAFKRQVGIAPGAFRRRRTGQMGPLAAP